MRFNCLKLLADILSPLLMVEGNNVNGTSNVNGNGNSMIGRVHELLMKGFMNEMLGQLLNSNEDE